jgi:F0F1-type ATP synthase alpha subunit
MQYIAPYSNAAMGEYFMMDSMLTIDDLQSRRRPIARFLLLKTSAGKRIGRRFLSALAPA